jgi:uncharacterized protein YcbK (DUF882 family)
VGDVSPHFSRSEFRCHGFGRPGHRAHDTPIDPDLLVCLEAIRARTGRPLRIVSGHRCAWWNSRVGGAGGSRHLLGEAADIPQEVVTPSQAAACGAVGIGSKGLWAVHVDTRQGRMARWKY